MGAVTPLGWSQETYVKPLNTGAGDEFGVSASIWGNVMAIGADYESSNARGVNGDDTDDGSHDYSGAAYIFE